jgi:DNA-binding Xre family transcriptional regulator
MADHTRIGVEDHNFVAPKMKRSPALPVPVIFYSCRILPYRRLFLYVMVTLMITLCVRDIAERKGITTAYQLQKVAQLHPGHAAKLWKGRLEMIGLKTMNTLCEALGCEPGDLFSRVRDGKRLGTRKRRS